MIHVRSFLKGLDPRSGSGMTIEGAWDDTRESNTFIPPFFKTSVLQF